jgi:hypothetical protein
MKGSTQMELRLYSFVNFYLSDIQKGIQTGHMAVDLVREYGDEDILPKHCDLVADWADNHKTFIVLNGGNNLMLDNTANICAYSGLPWTTFYEDEESLGGLRTCVGVVVPENYFNATYSAANGFETVDIDGRIIFDQKIDTPPPNSDQAIFNLIKLLKTSRLA